MLSFKYSCRLTTARRAGVACVRRPSKDTALPYTHAETVKVIHSSDGASKVEFLRRNDGLYEYRGYVERELDSGPDEDRRYWSAR